MEPEIILLKKEVQELKEQLAEFLSHSLARENKTGEEK